MLDVYLITIYITGTEAAFQSNGIFDWTAFTSKLINSSLLMDQKCTVQSPGDQSPGSFQGFFVPQQVTLYLN